MDGGKAVGPLRRNFNWKIFKRILCIFIALLMFLGVFALALTTLF